jgi:predicted short-subunit dehydrogenase-like oxidoreductase (DUF2520 family)
VGLVGAGRVATALGVLLERAGHDVVAASGRDASRERVARYLSRTAFTTAEEAAREAEVVVIGMPDDRIEPACSALAAAGALTAGRRVLHLSGSVTLAALAAAAAAGCGVLALHPLQSFPDVDTGIERLPGSGIGITAGGEADFEFGVGLALDVGGAPFRLRDDVKALYHSAAVFSANFLVTVQGLAADVLRRSGVDDPLALLEPLARTSFDRTFSLGPGAALTGPAARGDAGTIERNLAALSKDAPDAVQAYVALSAAAAELAVSAGRITREDAERVREELDRWR